MAMYLPRGSILEVAPIDSPNDFTELSEHNRQPLSIDTERIERKQRMANGRMRAWHVADKKVWSVNWTELPHDTNFTVDGKAGGEWIMNFMSANPEGFWIKVRLPDGTKSVHEVMTSSFSHNVNKRGKFEMWDIDISLEEV